MIKLKKEFRNNWLTALRSGDYPQTTDYLYLNKKDKTGYCCWGVACKVVGMDDNFIINVPEVTSLISSRGDKVIDNITNISFSNFQHKLINLNDGLTQYQYENYYSDYKFPETLKDRIETHFKEGNNSYYCSFDEIADFIEINTIPV